MEHRLAALFASVENALDNSTYTYSDSDYLVRKALVSFLEEENGLVASARQVTDPSDVVNSILNYIVSTKYDAADPADWYRDAARQVLEFSDLAYRNEITEDSSRYAALLPEGHPRAIRVFSLTASAHRNSFAEWMAADPRLSQEGSELVFRIYSREENYEGIEATFDNLKLEAMVASGLAPEDVMPVIAVGRVSRERLAMMSRILAPLRRRDRLGKFAEEFGRFKGFFSRSDGSSFSETGRTVGPGTTPNSYLVEFPGSPDIPKGIYEMDSSKGESVKAYLPKRLVKGLKTEREFLTEDEKKDAIPLADFLKTRRESPNNWEKSGKSFKSKDGKFTATPTSQDSANKLIEKAKERGDEPMVSGTGEGRELNPDASEVFVVADGKGRTKGVADDWAGVQEISIANGGSFDSGSDNLSTPKSDDVDVTGMTLDQLEREMGKPVDPSKPGSLDRYNKATEEFYKRGGYTALRKQQAKAKDESKPEPDLNQDTTPSMDSLSDDMLGEGFNFSKEDSNTWALDGVGPNGESYVVTRDKDGKYTVSERSGSGPDNFTDKDLQQFDNAREAFEYANDQSTSPNEFDQEWVNELLSDQDVDLNQGTVSKDRVDRSKLSPEAAREYASQLDEMDDAISGNDNNKINSLLERAALDLNMPDEVYSALYTAREARSNRAMAVENALEGGSKEELEELLDNPEFAGWKDRLQSALAEDVDLDQDAPVLSEKQAEPATGKQYAVLEEYLSERQLDPAIEQALRDAIENKNLNKAQAGALVNLGREAGFKPGVDSTKPSQRMIDSLQGYLATKDLTPSEIKGILDSLEADSSRDNVDALLNKLRRKKDKPVDLNQGTGSLIKYSDGNYEWEDVYNNVGVNKTKNGWEVDYTNPDLNDRGGYNWKNRIFNSEEEALAFAEELIKQNQEDAGYQRAADDYVGSGFPDADLDQDAAKGTLEDAATDKQLDFLESLVNGKKINDPELESAVRSAIKEKNLTKGQAGAFIGQLRPLEDKPNVRREPTAKQLASIKRGVLERGLSAKERKDLEDRLAEGISFDEASEILNDLKKRDITPQGMTDLLNKLRDDQDFDTLDYLLSKPEYSDYRDDIKDTMRQLALDTEDPRFQQAIDAREADDVDLNQDTGRSVSRDDLAEKLADDIDAKDVFLVSGDELISALEFFDTAKSSSSAWDMVQEIWEMANSLDNRNEPELAQRARDLSDRMYDEMIDRFGFGNAGRYENGADTIDLDDAQRIVRDERELFFETDADEIERKVDQDNSYGDSRSGGAEVFVSQEDDGTWTASVTYDRGDDQFNGEDRDDVIRQAAEAAADYNSDTIPSSYQEDADLSREAEEAKTPDQASAFADKLDAIADDLEGNRGDPQVAYDLRQSAQAIRDAIARREAQNQAQVPDEPTTPETMDEMATDPDLNPSGYASSVADGIFDRIAQRQEEDPFTRGFGDRVSMDEEFVSPDGRVVLGFNADGEQESDGTRVDLSKYYITIDGEEVSDGGQSDLSVSELKSELQRLVEEHFSKKA